jgi:hypothetical protein
MKTARRYLSTGEFHMFKRYANSLAPENGKSAESMDFGRAGVS